MKSAIFSAAIGLAGTAAAIGKAVVNNQCDYDIYIANTPCVINDVYQIDGPSSYSSGTPFSQGYTVIDPSLCGWSIKIGLDESISEPMQFEYTYSGDSTVWYDMSLVNVDALDTSLANTTTDGATAYQKAAPIPWSFSSSDDSACSPEQIWYNYWDNDDASQACDDTSVSITVNLCPSGSSSSSSSSSSVAASSTSTSSASAYSTASSTSTSKSSSASSTSSSSSSSSASATQTTFATSTSAAASSSSSSTSTARGGHHWTGVVKEADVQRVTSSSASASTTTAANGDVVTATVIDLVTEIATITARDAQPTPAAHRRHVHGHPHGAHQA